VSKERTDDLRQTMTPGGCCSTAFRGSDPE
jgi:hypothetical protein